MKVLMFGWEFPPHILGGLGTASYGLTKGMSQQEDMEITFCIPRPWGDEDQRKDTIYASVAISGSLPFSAACKASLLKSTVLR